MCSTSNLLLLVLWIRRASDLQPSAVFFQKMGGKIVGKIETSIQGRYLNTYRLDLE